MLQAARNCLKRGSKLPAALCASVCAAWIALALAGSPPKRHVALNGFPGAGSDAAAPTALCRSAAVLDWARLGTVRTVSVVDAAETGGAASTPLNACPCAGL